jgi:hypothetical protein
MLKQAGYFDIDNLDSYYRDCVITGLGAFVVPIRDKSQFVEATKTKLLREIAEAPADATLHKVQGSGNATCLAGERQWRDRIGN